jgi:hypothetical protein
MEALLAGQKLVKFSSYLGLFRDMDTLCHSTGSTLISSEDQADGSYRFLREIN